MDYKLIKNFRVLSLFMEIMGASTSLAVLLYLILSIMIGMPPFQGISRAIIIPIIIAPLMCYRLLITLNKLNITEEALQDSEIKFKFMVENSHDGMLIVDDNYHFIYVNSVLCNILGYSMNEIIGRDFRRFLDEGSKIIVAENYLRRQKGLSAPDKYELNIVRKDGEARRAEIRSAVKHDLKKGTQTYAHILDITEKKLAEEELQRSVKRYRDVFENTGTATVIIEKDTIISKANTKFEQISGYSKEEIEGKMSWTDFVLEDDLKRMINYHTERREAINEAPTTYEFQFIDKFGNIKQILINVNMLSDTDQSVASLLDITDMVKAKNDLKESEIKFRSITASAKDAIIMINGSGIVTYWNEAAERMFGHTSDDILGKDLHMILAPAEFSSIYKAAFPKFQKSGQGPIVGKTLELTGLNKNRIKFPIELSVSTLELNGEWNAIGIVRDISKRKKLEKVLQQTHKMEAIGCLAGGIAHDFNNILSAIIGYTELLQMNLSENSAESRYALQIKQAGSRAKDLVEQILTFSRQTEQELKPVEVNIIAKEVVKLIRSSLPTTIEIKQNLQNSYIVLGDPTQIHQILMNLCTNAGHAMQEKGGQLAIDLKRFELKEDLIGERIRLSPGIYVQLSVSDTGRGISTEHIDRIFDPFFTTKERGEGTGMGLSVVHGIVESYKGAVHVASEEGKGSTFTIYLPAIETHVKQDESKAEEIPKGTGHILFVDDESIIVEMNTSQLEALGYKVSSRSNSIEALGLIKKKPDSFDLVITDMTMPKMKGDEFAKEIKRIRPDIPIILCTGFGNKMTPESIQKLGIDAFLMKPIIMRDMAKNIRNLLDKKKLL
jgi:PAS domain S-box-containing protein